MSWEDRDYAEDPWRKLGKPGGDWQGLRPTLDNPMSWALPLFRVARITVRIHLLFVLFVAIELLKSVAGPSTSAAGQLGPGVMSLFIATLFLIVLLHEFGHCFACRWTGGDANEILMWPLGGLAFCLPPNTWKAHFITAAGGPMVNVVIFLLTAPTLGFVTGDWLGTALPNPLKIYDPLFIDDTTLAGSLLFMALYCLHATNLILILFNLIPMFPFDGGRILQTLLWPRFGYANSMRFAVRTGFVGAILLAVFGAVINEWLFVGLAVFGGFTCYITHKQLEFTETMMGGESEEYATSVLLGEDDADAATAAKPTRREKRAMKQAEADAQEQAQVDRVLAKIAERGMESLTSAEKKLLQRATEKKRRG